MLSKDPRVPPMSTQLVNDVEAAGLGWFGSGEANYSIDEWRAPVMNLRRHEEMRFWLWLFVPGVLVIIGALVLGKQVSPWFVALLIPGGWLIVRAFVALERLDDYRNGMQWGTFFMPLPTGAPRALHRARVRERGYPNAYPGEVPASVLAKLDQLCAGVTNVSPRIHMVGEFRLLVAWRGLGEALVLAVWSIYTGQELALGEPLDDAPVSANRWGRRIAWWTVAAAVTAGAVRRRA